MSIAMEQLYKTYIQCCTMKHLYQETQIIALDIPKIYNTHSINRYIISVNVNTKLNKISQYLGI